MKINHPPPPRTRYRVMGKPLPIRVTPGVHAVRNSHLGSARKVKSIVPKAHRRI